MLAARRGDVDGLIPLFERYDRLQTGRSRLAYRTGSFAFAGPGLAMSQGMSVLADRKDLCRVLRLVDFNLAFARRKQEHQSPGAAARPARSLRRSRLHGLRPGFLPDLGRPAVSARADPVSPGERVL